MGKYIGRRLLWIIPILLGVTILIFSILYFVPGDPAQIILGTGASPAEVAALRADMGLDDPYLLQIGRYLKQVFFHFDFGKSYSTGIPVATELRNRLPYTVSLGITGMVIMMLMGIPLGIIAAVYRNSWGDRLCMMVAMVGVSMPSFWFALMLILLFALRLGWLPPFGIGGIQYYILPVLCLAFNGLGAQARMSRSCMLEVIRSDYMTTARSKGLAENEVLYKHGLPNALIPIITSSGSRLAHLFGGSTVIETVFSIPGIGSYMIGAINARDYPVIQGSVIFLAFVFALCMLLVDLCYAFVDPRIKAQYVKK
jgi:peptide/nickel transport system permease protein